MVIGSPTKLNLIPSGVMPVVYINQGDAGYDKEFLIYNGDSAYNVPSGVSATIRGTKADGYGVTEAAAITTGSNLVTVTITEQMVAASGKNVYELVFVDSNDLRVASINMIWAVKPDALGDSVISDSDLDYVSQALNKIQNAEAMKNQLNVNTAAISAETAARISADNTLQSNITAEASTRSSQDALLQAEIDQLIAPTGTAPSAAEIENARIGADGITYPTLGDAIRTQDANLSSALNIYKSIIGGTYVFSGYERGWNISTYSIMAGKTYVIKNIGSNAISPIYTRASGANAETILDNTTDFAAGSELEFTATQDADGISAYYKGSSGTRGISIYQKDTLAENVALKSDIITDMTSVFASLTASNDVFSNGTLLNTATYSGTYWTALPAELLYNKTGVLEFTLDSDTDSVLLALSGSNSYASRMVLLLDNVPLKAGTYRFVVTRLSNMNYVEMRLNNAAPSDFTIRFYDTDKNYVSQQLKVVDVINSSNYAAKLPDLNDAANNTAYVLFVSTAGYPANLPHAINGYTQMLVITYSGSNTYKVQIAVSKGEVYSRVKNGSGWTAWESYKTHLPKTYEVNPSYTDGTEDNDGVIRYSTLAGAIEEAVKYRDSTVYVTSGTYDILSEYQALHPEDWSTRNDGRGINLNRGIKLIFGTNSVVECKYTGNDTNVLNNFSAFNVRQGSAEIINATIDASRVRYCVHDDMYSSAIPYHVLYKNCNMKLDNSLNPERSKIPHCIGGGFGQNGHIVIEECIFEGIGGDGTVNPAPDDNAIVNWHNGPNASQKSDLFMTGCYFKGSGTFGAVSLGTATEKSTFLISGNSFGSPIIDRDQITTPTQANIEIIAFNNEIRN